ncbi:MAG: hypothetical protein ABMA64_07080 [Myxococcota bacterium]
MEPGFGIGVFDTRLEEGTLAPVGAGTFDSAYSEAGPQPGRPASADAASTWRPHMRGAQSVDLEVQTIRGGYPGLILGAAVAYRLGSETADTDWRSWDEPNLLTDWTTPLTAWGSVRTWEQVTAVVLPDSHALVVVARATSGDANAWAYDSRTDVWADLHDFTTNPGLEEPIALAYDEEGGRLVLFGGAGTVAGDRQQLAYQSTDGGTTWSIYSRGMYDAAVNASVGPMSVAPARGQDWLALAGTGLSYGQWASSDRGVTWNLVAAPLSGGLHHCLRATNGFVVAYARTADSFLCVRRISAARSSFEAAEEILAWSFATQNVVGCRDYDGALYLYATSTGGATQVLVSYDEGATWIEFQSSTGTREYALNSPGIQPTWRAAVPSAGSIFCVGTHELDTQWHACRFGGWTNVEGATRNDIGSLRLGPYRFGAGAGIDYVALEFPDTYGQWTRVGAAGTRSMSGADVGLEIACTQAQVERYQAANNASADYWCAGAGKHRVSAATQGLGGVGPVFNSGLCWEIVLDNGANRYTAHIEIGSDGLRVHDGGTQRASYALDATRWFHLRYSMQPGKITVWVRQAGTKWARIANGVTITGAASVAAGTYAIWGHLAAGVAGTSTLYTGYAFHSYASGFRHGLDSVASSDDAYSTGVLGLAYGRRLPGRSAAYPIPDATGSAEDVGFITAVGGPTYIGEQVALETDHVFGVGQVHPDQAASPRNPWRSTDTSQVSLVYDQGAPSWYGGALALAALAADLRTAVLELDDGAGAWSTVATLDKGVSGIFYTLSGTLAPRTGGASIDRYLQEGELVGGYVVMSTAGTPVARRIVRQSAGFWVFGGSVQTVRIEVDGIDGTELAAGSGEIVWPSGVLVAYPSADTPRRYLRIRIPGAQIVPDGTYSAGILSVARLFGVGADPGWDWSSLTRLQREESRGADGTPQYRETGPPRRVLTYGWPDGCDLRAMRRLVAAPSPVVASGGQPFGTSEDAWTVATQLATQLRSGEVPALVCPRLPSATSTLTDPTMWFYGVLQSEAVGVSSIVGTEGVDEVLRVDSLAFEELR